MPAEIYNLEVLLRARSTGLAAFKEAENGLLGVAATAVAVGAILAGAVVAGAVKAVDNLENVGHAAYDMSKSFGILPAQASAWVNAAAQVGISTEQMDGIFKIFAKNVGLGSEATTKAFAALGVETRDATGNFRPLNDILFDVADKFAGMQDGAQKAGLGAQIFGRNYAVLLPLLDQGAAGIKEAMRLSDLYGANLTGPQVMAAQKAFEAHKKLDQALAGVGSVIAVALLPFALRLSNWLLEVTPRVLEFARVFMEKAVPAIENFIKQVQDFVTKAKPYVEEFVRTAVDQFNQIWPVAKEVGRVLAQILMPAIKDLAAHWEMLKPVVQALVIILAGAILIFAAVVVAVVQVIDWLVRLADYIRNDVIVQFHQINDGLIGAIRWFQAFTDVVRDVVIWLGNLWTAFSHAWTLDAVIHIVGLDGLKTVWDLINKIRGGRGDAGFPVPGGGGGVVGLTAYASGGMVSGPIGAPQLAILHGGERVQTPAQQQGDDRVVTLLQQLIQAVYETASQGASLSDFASANAAAQFQRNRGIVGA